MPGPARAGALIYARDARRLAEFYCHVIGMQVLRASDELLVIENADFQLVLHQHSVVAPAAVREQTVKLFFSVDSLAAAITRAETAGGNVVGPTYPGPGFTVQNFTDPEGNLFHLREWGR